MKTSTLVRSTLILTLALAPIACADDSSADDQEHDDHDDHDDQTGDGDGDPSTGDGDGDGDPTGDGDGDPTGDGDGDPSGDGDGDPSGDGDGDALCGAVECTDAITLDLSLQADKIAEGAVGSTADDGVWTSTIDASAGGVMMAATNPWVYAKFTDDGLVKIEIDDIDALASSDWDIAAKRFGIRVNSGSSGAGCVGVAVSDAEFDALDSVPGEAEFAFEDFYTDACVLIEDDSGLAGNPDYLMAGWWGYTSCVTTTGAVYLIELADERVVKLTVDAYYAQGQQACNDAGTMGTGSGTMTWRWAFLD
jgi:hypothetical protein